MAVQKYPKASTTKLSKNFSAREFRCGLGRPCSACSVTLIDPQLVKYLQQIRDYFGAEVEITSGYRCENYNRSIGGATGSRHSKGQAADIVVNGVAPRRVAAYAEYIGVKGIGLYETGADGYFVHIDTRDYKSYWYGQAQAGRSTFGGAAAMGPGGTGSTTASKAPAAGNGYTLGQFITDVQKVTGATVDGVAGPETLGATPTISKTKNSRHAAVKAVQKRLAALGYTQVGEADGVAGELFHQALKAYQIKNGLPADGEATKNGPTWRKLLGMA
jgi:peptidoglycan hydrolase-like protein with peptidoglycan-binding domain